MSSWLNFFATDSCYNCWILCSTALVLFLAFGVPTIWLKWIVFIVLRIVVLISSSAACFARWVGFDVSAKTVFSV